MQCHTAELAASAVSPPVSSEEWGRSSSPLHASFIDDNTDIIELDFADTSALSDPEMFMSKVQEKGMMKERVVTRPIEEKKGSTGWNQDMGRGKATEKIGKNQGAAVSDSRPATSLASCVGEIEPTPINAHISILPTATKGILDGTMPSMDTMQGEIMS